MPRLSKDINPYVGALLQDGRDKHNQRNVQRESSRAPRPVNAENLVRIGSHWGGNEAVEFERPISVPLRCVRESERRTRGEPHIPGLVTQDTS